MSCPKQGKTLDSEMYNYLSISYQISIALVLLMFNNSQPLNGELIKVHGMKGGMVQLPCNISNSPDDSIRIIFWFRNSIKGGPIYTIDARSSNLSLGTHFTPFDTIAPRASFDYTSNPAYLTIDPLKEEDMDDYKCRVDFAKDRTLFTFVSLKVIAVPTEMEVSDKNGLILENIAGPYDEESNIELLCHSKGGTPLPSLIWFLNDNLIDADYEIKTDNKTVTNGLALVNINRSLFNAVLVCQAFNSLYRKSINISITLDLNLKPLSVHILKPNTSFIAGQRYELICISKYSRPPAVITWIKHKRNLSNQRELVNDDVNTTSSILSFVPFASDDGHFLICKAENVRLRSSYLEDKLLLNVLYKPIVHLYIDNLINKSLIKLGDDVYLRCKAKAKPKVIFYSWFKNDQLISSHSGQSSQNGSVHEILFVDQNDVARYKCLAENKIGVGESESFDLQVRFAPVCKPNQKLVYGIKPQETIRILCNVDAHPSPVHFYWTINETSIPMNNKYLVNIEHLRSSLLFKSNNRYDHGTVRCWAKNTVGLMNQPCVFHIVPADKPSPVKECKLIKLANTSVEIKCKASYDGGLGQIFHLEVYIQSSKNMISQKISNESPHFNLHKLMPSTDYLFLIYSSNIMGKSSPSVSLALRTESINSKEAIIEVNTDHSWQVGIIILILSIACFFLIYVFIKIKLRSTDSTKIYKEELPEMLHAHLDDCSIDSYKSTELKHGPLN